MNFRRFHESGSFVRSLNATFLVLIPKKGGLKEVLAKVISMSQNVFVEGRESMDEVLIANKAIDSILKSNRGAILCKLDIEKAYDHVDWSFLLAVLEKMGFGESSRGLRQGNPLLPYLFVIVMEAFSCLLKRAVSKGLRVNMEKSELIPVGRVENVEELAEEFGYKVGRLPSTYLGMPLGAPFKSVATWDGIEERFRKRLAMWKRLGVKSLGTFNRALLGKRVWCFAIERKALRNQVIRRKYGEERGGWSSCEAREAYGVGLWKAISKLGHLVTPSFDFVVGDGKKVRFWKDKWCGTTPLCEDFPSLFALATSKEA
ncbi:hypothetical protein CK203_051369 [Vitis vinifera]|uniref:Reverse transcriptase domain-containing protein n=1 Tax=Vitis vinifera TaxID=29760 RepID=A0A438FLV7_VITVI|nr:hypothetical protein CK203_051369 [Vitis vinifera]